MKISEENLKELIEEFDEIYERCVENFDAIRKEGVSEERVDNLFRDVHTLKGSSQLFGFEQVSSISHIMETALGPMRKFKMSMPPLLLDLFLNSLDLIEDLVKGITVESGEPVLKERVDEILGKLLEASTSIAGGDFKGVKEMPPIAKEKPARELKKGGAISPAPKAAPKAAAPDPKPKPAAKVTVKPVTPKPAPKPAPKQEPVKKEVKVQAKATPAPSPGANKMSNSKAEAEAPDASKAGPVDSTVRVSVELLDKLMNLAGELVLIRNQVLQYSGKKEDIELTNLSQGLDLVTSELQSEVMKTRMQPVGSILNKFQRVVRNLGSELGKKVELTIEGAETELDKSLLEAVKDLLTHIIRNSVDHGIELPEERLASGKSEGGKVEIKAFHEGGQVVIQIRDDGKGLKKLRIMEKAIEKGLVTQGDLEKMSDKDIFALIFNPGFSTAEKVTSVSGRGVGMDVVKNNIEKIGGSIDLESEEGVGSQLSLKIPLTLAIVPAMIVQIDNESFCIPQIKLVELVRVEKSRENRIELLEGRPFYRLRRKLLPLINLYEILNRSGRDVNDIMESESVNVIVLNANGQQFGLIVDKILDSADIVVKPLPNFLGRLEQFSGATILGNGSVSLILDVEGISRTQNLDNTKTAEVLEVEGESVSLEDQDYLLFETYGTGVYSVPLCVVQRLEIFGPDSIEFSGEQEVIRYRGEILPILNVNCFLKLIAEEDNSEANNEDSASSIAATSTVNVIVVKSRGKYYGIQVNSILDIVTIRGQIDGSLVDRPGLMGNIIFNDSVVTIIDALQMIKEKYQLEHEEPFSVVESNKSNGKPKILLAEDSKFFRRQITKILDEANFEVISFENGELAYEYLKNEPDAKKIDLILSDIEMPLMNGIEFVQHIRKNDEFKSLPVVAITTKFRQADIEEGMSAGFNTYLEKLNGEQLCSEIGKLLKAA